MSNRFGRMSPRQRQNLIWVPKPSPPLNLPRDVYTTISKHILPQGQPAFRRLNTTARSSGFDLSMCFRDITPNEIAIWLLEQQRLIREDIKHRKSKLWNLDRNKYPIVLQLNTRPQTPIFSIDTNTGNITADGVQLDDERQIVSSLTKKSNLLLNTKPIMDFSDSENNWQLVIDILKNRKSCYLQGLTPHKVFIQMVADHTDFHYFLYSKLAPAVHSILYLKRLLTPLGQRKFVDVILQKFGIEFLSEYFNDNRDRYGSEDKYDKYNKDDAFVFDHVQYITSVKDFILSLSPEDLMFN